MPRVEVTEGVEDFTVLGTRDLGRGNVHLSIDYDSRIVDLAATVPTASYDRARLATADAERF